MCLLLRSCREGSQSPVSRKRKRLRRRSAGEDTTTESQDASSSSDMPQQMGVPPLGIAPVAEERVHADPTDSLGRSALMTQLTKPADEMLQVRKNFRLFCQRLMETVAKLSLFLSLVGKEKFVLYPAAWLFIYTIAEWKRCETIFSFCQRGLC